VTHRTHANEASSVHAHQAPGRRGWTSALVQRWPTWFAIALAAVTAGDPGSVGGRSEALLLFAFGYLAAAVIRRRRATWVVAVVGIGALAALRPQDWVEPWVLIIVAAVAFVLWGTARGRMWPPGALMVETAGMVVFAAIALAAVSVDPDLGLYLVAAGWAGHALWDFAHLLADKVVARSFAEWCGIFALLGAVGILVVAML
jgi:hypothetical protein